MFDITPGKTRLFAFGCSFTDYIWTSWPQILGHNYRIPLYNYGCAGAGNLYISNHIVQADRYYNFQPEDIVAVCWTNVCREDRYVENKWHTSGNIFTNDIYGKEWNKKWADPTGMAIRDYALIELSHNFVQSKTDQYLFLSMCDIARRKNQWGEADTQKTKVDHLYSDTLTQITNSFYDVLWNDDNMVKQIRDTQQVHPRFIDGHPSPKESLEYLQAVTDIKFNNETKVATAQAHQSWQEILSSKATEYKKDTFRVSDLNDNDIKFLKSSTEIWPSEKVKKL